MLYFIICLVSISLCVFLWVGGTIHITIKSIRLRNNNKLSFRSIFPLIFIYYIPACFLFIISFLARMALSVS